MFIEYQNVNQYEELGLIGSGAYGTVFKARDRNNDGQMVALKKVRVPLAETGVPISILREISVLKQLQRFDHPNVVKSVVKKFDHFLFFVYILLSRLLDICQGRNLAHEKQFILFLVFEHVEQDLYTFLQKCPPPGLGPDKIKVG